MRVVVQIDPRVPSADLAELLRLIVDCGHAVRWDTLRASRNPDGVLVDVDAWCRTPRTGDRLERWVRGYVWEVERCRSAH